MVLRELKSEDAVGMLEWMHDKDIQKKFQFAAADRTMEDVLEFIHSASDVVEHGKSLHYAITEDGGEYLGTISLKNPDLHAKNAEYAIVLRKKAQGCGLAACATEEILKKAFDEIALERVYLNVLEDNTRAISLYEKSGFVYEGEFRNHLFLNGRYRTLKWYGILKEEYKQKNKVRSGR